MGTGFLPGALQKFWSRVNVIVAQFWDDSKNGWFVHFEIVNL